MKLVAGVSSAAAVTGPRPSNALPALAPSPPCQVLEHVSLPFLAVAEIHRALKPGGRVLLAVPG
jgi:hypothetical protein